MNPVELADQLVTDAHEYSVLSDQLASILRSKPSIWLTMRKECSSDTQTERMWSATPEGIVEAVARLKLKALEKVMSATRTRLRLYEVEARNIV